MRMPPTGEERPLCESPRVGEREKVWEAILNQESIPKQLAGMTVS